MLYTFTGCETIHEAYIMLLRSAVLLAAALSLLCSLDRLLHVTKYALHSSVRKFGNHKPQQPSFKSGCLRCPTVAVQLPMFNERAVCQSVIDAACNLEWPLTALKIQVLDDSTDRITRDLVDDKIVEWLANGVDIEVLRRTNRAGYKAGALKEGLDRLQQFDYVAIFDADFRPDSSFLVNTVPHMMHNLKLGFVQARWTFTNPEQSYLTKAQEISLNFHCKCEQYAHCASGSFFNFNGTAGVWRVSTIMDVGGWNSRTTVEDMDLSLRAYLAGWQGLFLDSVTCLNELPACFFAYRKQQHRWTCGPVQLWRKASQDIWRSNLSTYRKLELILCYFGIRKVATHWVSMCFFCGIVPLSIFTPEVWVPLWALVHVPILVTLTTASFTPKGWLHCIHFVLFENAMGLVRLGAVIAGLLDMSRASEWVVTTKLGASDQRPGTAAPLPRVRTCRFYAGEVAMSLFMLTAATYGALVVQRFTFSIFLLLQGLAFLAFGLNMVDCGNLLGRKLNFSVSKAAQAKVSVEPHSVERTYTL